MTQTPDPVTVRMLNGITRISSVAIEISERRATRRFDRQPGRERGNDQSELRQSLQQDIVALGTQGTHVKSRQGHGSQSAEQYVEHRGRKRWAVLMRRRNRANQDHSTDENQTQRILVAKMPARRQRQDRHSLGAPAS